MIKPGILSGSITPPPSKSLLHRYILCAALAEGESRIENVRLSEDIRATLGCVSALGAEWRLSNDALFITGMGGRLGDEDLPNFDCGECGTTLRLLIPVACVLCGGGVFSGNGRLLQRPLKPYFDIFDEQGIEYKLTGNRLELRGRLRAGEYSIPGNLSSQFFSGLMYAMALCPGKSRIIAQGELQSSDYADMTVQALRLSGLDISRSENCFIIKGGNFCPMCCAAEADWSQAAFWIAANALGSDIRISGLNPNSEQGDRRIVYIINQILIEGAKEIDLSQCPDLLPPAATVAAFGNGSTRFTGCDRLRYKESDRLSSVREVLFAMGAEIVEHSDGLTIIGQETIPGGVAVDCHNDHRIAMMAAIASLRCLEPVKLAGCECVNKSYPNFFEHFRSLGGEAFVV